MQNLNTRPATRKVGQSTEIVKLLRIQASDTHVVEFDNVDSWMKSSTITRCTNPLTCCAEPFLPCTK